MSEWTPEERKAYRRTEKACEAMQSAIEGLHPWTDAKVDT